MEECDDFSEKYKFKVTQKLQSKKRMFSFSQGTPSNTFDCVKEHFIGRLWYTK